ncbi:MAG: GGDEF domain-containing protein [Butyrivibrio sp.]|nr:GGDEF domain-containing protein [Butyrivibrio sp.]
MERSVFRKLFVIFYILIILIFVGLGFCYTNEAGDQLYENLQDLNSGWTVNGESITFPYVNKDNFVISNTLPQVYGDQILVIKSYFDYFEAYIDGELIIASEDSKLFDIGTDVGNKEIWIPLEADYSNKEITVRIIPQKSLYTLELAGAFITTRSAYSLIQLRSNVPSVVLFILFTVTGILEIIISLFFIFKNTKLIRAFSFEALLYAGLFSVAAAQWIINETRIPFIIFGHTTGFSILKGISFLLLPLLFLEISRAIFSRKNLWDIVIDRILAFAILIACFLCLMGIIDWSHLKYLAHVIDIIVIIICSHYSYTSIKEEKNSKTLKAISITNALFLIIGALSLFQYIYSSNKDYIAFIILDLLIYVMVQVGLIYRRIGLNVKEQEEFAEAKVFAFTDELTKLGNRRYFYNAMEKYEKEKLSNDTTIIAIDVNRLKYYNDTYGHDAGDELLVGTAECIQKAFDSTSNAIISRMGGDEFDIIIIENENNIISRIYNLKTLLSQWKGKYVNDISIAIGYATIEKDGHMSLEDLAKIADNRMYTDKAEYYKKSGLDRRSTKN